MVINLARNKQEFEELTRKHIKREGLEKVLAWLDTTDFYSAPASTRYHLAVAGGLCQHALNVFEQMVILSNLFYGKDFNDDNIYGGETLEADGAFNIENIAVAALFHDICKANCYVKDFKNVKVDGKWEQQEYWRWDEQFIYGHGSKSVYILQQFMRLFIAEAQAIRYHMGAYGEDPLSDIQDRQHQKVWETSSFALILHLADLSSTYLLEKEEEL